MPLPSPEPREELHLRRIEARGFRRHDGLFEVEGRVGDTRTAAFQLAHGEKRLAAGRHLHEMTVRITFNQDFVVTDAIAVTDASPHSICPEVTPALAGLKGLVIGAGWNRGVRERLGGALGCQHINELLAQMATVAFQSLAPLRHAMPLKLDHDGRPVKIDSCYAYASKREVVRVRWPEHYDGPR